MFHCKVCILKYVAQGFGIDFDETVLFCDYVQILEKYF